MGNNNINVGNISGGKNKIKQNNIHINNIKNVQHNHGGNSGLGKHRDDANQGIAIVVGIFAVMVVMAFFYLRHYDTIFMCMKLTVIAVVATHLMAAIPIWQNPQVSNNDVGHSVFGMLLAAAQLWVVMLTYDAMPAEAVNFAHQYAATKPLVSQAWDVWSRLSAYGQHVVMSNMLSAFCLATAIFLNLLYGLQHLLQLLAQSKDSEGYATVAYWLRSFKKVGSFMSFALIVVAYLITTGVLFTSK